MKLSARNQFEGTVTRITNGQAMAEVTVKVGTLEFAAAITEGSVKSMGLKVNDSVTVAIKATDVMVGK
ncbi:MAG: TOBE domain-containing protein [Nitrospira sp.]|nr:TOBE domain-containing protein [Nitrospira sp.]